ncbi:hypothetical protein SAMN03159423_4519 [Bradyrhizobium sp. NFR13]|nr:hypothetical protein SAMN03159423_4519 [Bradyrhizobium sp. NFR13]
MRDIDIIYKAMEDRRCCFSRLSDREDVRRPSASSETARKALAPLRTHLSKEPSLT